MDYSHLFHDQEFKIVIKPNGDLTLTTMAGESLSIETATWLMKRLNAAITVTKYLYVISGDGAGKWKIGISDDPHRRAKELNGYVYNKIPLESGLCWRLEKHVHGMLHKYHIGNEWFDFTDENGKRLINILIDDVQTQSHLWNFVCNPALHKLATGSD